MKITREVLLDHLEDDHYILKDVKAIYRYFGSMRKFYEAPLESLQDFHMNSYPKSQHDDLGHTVHPWDKEECK